MNLINKNFEIRDYLRILMRRKFYFIIPCILVLTAGIYKITTKIPEYESSCVIQITTSRLPTGLQRVVPGVTYYQRAVGLKMQILNSPNLIKIINKLKLNENEKVRLAAQKMKEKMPEKDLNEIIQFILIKNLKKNLRVRAFGDNYIEIKITASSSESAFDRINAIMEIFMDEFLDRELASVQKVKDFNYEQLEIYKKELEQAERNLNQYKQGLIINQNIKNKILSEEALNRIDEAIVATDITIKMKKDYLDYIKTQLNHKEQNIVKEFPKTPVINNFYSEIEMKIIEMADLMKIYSWNSSELIKANKTINTLRDNIKIEIEKYYRDYFNDFDAHILSSITEIAIALLDIDIAKEKKKVLNQVIETSKYSVSTFQANELTQTKLEEAVKVSRGIYNLFLEQIQGTQIEESIQRANESSRFNIIEPPIKPLEPTNAANKLHLMLVILFAVISGIVFVYLLEILDRSIRTVEEAEEFFEIAVIGVIPFVENEPFVSTKNFKKDYNQKIDYGEHSHYSRKS